MQSFDLVKNTVYKKNELGLVKRSYITKKQKKITFLL